MNFAYWLLQDTGHTIKIKLMIDTGLIGRTAENLFIYVLPAIMLVIVKGTIL
jgi:hypothetical protein